MGNGVADDKAIYPYVPALIEYYLGEKAILPNIDTYDLQDAEQREFVIDRLDRMVLKPVDGSGGYGLVVGDQASDEQLERLRQQVLGDPRGWIAQRIVRISTCPTLVGSGQLAPRHVDLRPFAVNDGENIFVLPGGLTRVALPEGSLVVNSSQGGGSKDTWVVAEPDELMYVPPERPTPRLTRVLAAVPARVHSPTTHDERMRQQENQQQQSHVRICNAFSGIRPDTPSFSRLHLRTRCRSGHRIMLSRIAESYFWIGRYLERAEATSRLLAEHHQLMVEERTVPEELAAAVLLDALSLPPQAASSAGDLVSAVVGTSVDPATISGAITMARENARGVRESLSADVFEALNAAHLAGISGPMVATSPAYALYRVVERLAVVVGQVDWTVPRDEGYLFLSLGRSLERLDMVSRVLAVRHDQLWPEGGPVATLRAAAALNAFLRTQHPMTGDEARKFLLLDGDFPRSMRVSASTAEEAVRGLAARGASDGGDLLREVGLMRSQLEYAVDPTPDEVDALVELVQQASARASDVVAQAFFRPVGTIVWSN
ncbi:MAG: circularly permuted type 2 ATP-grasp protein [Candidatus Nanopelagicales bacterium]